MDKSLLYGIGIVLLCGYFVYRSLIQKKNNVKEAIGGIDVQLNKRYDLIPNMMKSAAKFMQHEKDIFLEVTKLRQNAMEATDPNARFKAEQELSHALHQFKLTAENYPELKSDQSMVAAMQAMSEVEEHIAAARRFYNSAVKDYKNALEIFPTSVLAKFIGLKDIYPFYEAEEVAKARIDVNEYFK